MGSIAVAIDPLLQEQWCHIDKVRGRMVSNVERINVFPSGIKGQIAAIQTHSESADTAQCGDIRIKLNMNNGIELIAEYAIRCD